MAAPTIDPEPPAVKLAERIAGLSPRKRELLLSRLGAGRQGVPAGMDGQPAAPGAPEPPRDSRGGAAVPRRPQGAALRLSYTQESLWFVERLAPGNVSYNIAAALRVEGALDAGVLARSLAEIAGRHEALRMRFADDEGVPRVVVAERERLALPQADLAALPAARRRREALRLAGEQAALPFDLGVGPPARALLVRWSPRQHLAVFTLHHLIADGQSMAVLVRELVASYEAAAAGRPSPLPPLRLQYGDYALWQRRRFEQGAMAAPLAWWLRQLAGPPPALEMPADRPRPVELGWRGASRAVTLARPLADSLAALGRRQGVTLFTTVLAGFAALLGRCSGQQDFAIGTPVAGRPNLDCEELIGLFVNTLALRVDLSGDPTWLELVGRMGEVVLEAQSRQEVPFERLVRELSPERSLDRSPLFQVSFTLDMSPPAVRRHGALEWAPLELESRAVQFELGLYLTLGSEGLRGRLAYSTELFDGATAARLVERLERLLAEAMAAPRLPLSQLTCATEGERQQLLREWNDTAVAYEARGDCLHELLAAAAARTPDAVALVYCGRTLTYRETWRRAHGLAARLQDAGVRPGTPVGVCAERSLELVIALLAVLAAGGAYLPLDPELPPRRLELMLRDAGAPVLLAQQRWLQLAAALGRGAGGAEGAAETAAWWILPLAEDAADVAGSAAAPVAPAPAALPENPAYVIFTSGSTGRPKGVMVPHRGIVNRLLWMQERYRLRPGDRILQKTPFTFDVSVWELFWPLLTGARLVLAEPGRHRDSEYLIDLIAAERITVLHFVPAMLQAFLDSPRLARCGSLRQVMASGEALGTELARRFFERMPPGVELNNLYGPTEASVDVTAWHCGREDGGHGRGGVPIGRPIANSQLWVLDRHGAPVPAGSRGELYLGGAGLALGYLGRPDLTAERFVPLPRGLPASEPGCRIYRTGDLVRFLPDGSVEFLGRNDRQVKVRGFRVELGEIEQALAAHPEVREAAAAVRADANGGQRLMAVVVARDGAKAAPAQLEAHLRQVLPPYMVPALYLFVDRLPAMPNGKVDRRALAALELPRAGEAGTEEGGAEPGTPRERLLAAIWCELLDLDRVGAQDDFFRLGGDSISSLQMVARAERAGLRLTPRQVFQHPRLADLARAGVEADGEDAVAAAVPASLTAAAGTGAAGIRAARLARASRVAAGPVPLGPVQQWFFALPPIDPHHFNQAVLLEVRRGADLARLMAAVRRWPAAHDALRLRCRRLQGRWVAWMEPPATGSAALQPARIDLGALPEERRREAQEAAAAGLQASLDLERGPLARVALFDPGPGAAYRLLVVIHHLAVDAVSWRVLLEELDEALSAPAPIVSAARAGLAEGGEAGGAGKGVSFRGWVELLTELVDAPEWREEAAYWLRQLRAPAVTLPADGQGGSDTLGSSRVVEETLGSEETRLLLQVAAPALGVEPNELLLTALARVLGSWTGEPRVLVDLEGHGREEVVKGLDASRTVGWLTCIYPVWLEGAAGREPAMDLAANRERLRAVPRRGVGYGMLRYLSRDAELRRQLQAAGPAQVLFNYFGRLDRGLAASAWLAPGRQSPGPSRSPRRTRSHALEVTCTVIAGSLRMEWSYGEAGHRRATIERLATAMASELRQLAALPVPAAAPEGAAAKAPVTFPLSPLPREELLTLERSGGAIEDVYPLTPMQQGLLFHTLLAPRSEVYFDQLCCRMRGPLNAPALRQAWQEAVDRHPILRTGFVWDSSDEPAQVVRRRVEVPWREEDWSGLAEDQQRQHLEAWLAADRQAGFEPARAPLLRLAVIRRGHQDHWFIWSHHHLLLDGWSAQRLMSEVLARYQSLCGGQAAPPSHPPPRPFVDYVRWLRQQDRAAGEAFWRGVLAGFRLPTRLISTAANDPAAAAKAGADAGSQEPAGYDTRELWLTAADTALLAGFARRHGLTLNTLVQGAWAVLLARHSGAGDVVYGTTVAGRPPRLAGVEAMVGLFINTLPVRLRVTGEEGVLPWLREVQDFQSRIREFEHLPLADVLSWSELPVTDTLFDTLLIFESYPVERGFGSELAGLEISELRHLDKPSYPLTLLVVPGPRLHLLAKALPHRFAGPDVTRALAQLRRLLVSLAAVPAVPSGRPALAGLPAPPTADEDQRRLGELELLAEEERHQLLCEWNDTAAAPLPGAPISLAALYQAAAARRPEAVALRHGGMELSYGELDGRVAGLAAELRCRGVGPEERVAVLLGRSMELVVALLAVWRAGGAFVVLSPDDPPERHRQVLADARPRLLVTAARHLEELAASPSPMGVLCLDGVEPPPARPRRPASVAAAGPGHLAYIAYTSGSTGGPKGVLIEQRGVLDYFAFLGETYGLDERDVVLQLAPLTFDAAVRDLLSPLALGACVVLLDDAAVKDAFALLAALRRERVTCLASAVPTRLRQLAEATAETPAAGAGGGPLRLVLSSGEALRPGDWRGLAPLFAGPPVVVNQYGATECTLSQSWHRLPLGAAAAGEAAAAPLGRPIRNARLHVLDTGLRPVPAGAIGEIYIGAAGIARGYLGRPDLTAARFVPDPFGAVPGGRLYRTGDLGHLGPAGELLHDGRVDHQLKVRSFRVEPGEVETVLCAHSAIRAAAVAVRQLASGEQALVAFLEDAQGGRPVAHELRRHCASRLPSFMVPSAFVWLPALPRNAHGKVDRPALPAQLIAPPRPDHAATAPHTATEQLVAGIWREVLGLDEVGIHDRFFELGGSSVSAMRAASRIRRTLAVEVSLASFFELETVARIAGQVDRLKTAAGATTAAAPPAIQPVSRQQRRVRRSELLRRES